MRTNILSCEQIDYLNEIVSVLETFSIASDMLSGQRYVSCSFILPLFSYLKKVLDPEVKDSKFKAHFKNKLKNSIDYYFDRFNVESEPLLACSFLCPKYKELKFLEKNIRQEKIDNLHKYLKGIYEKYLKEKCIIKSDTISNLQRDSKKTKLTFNCAEEEEVYSFEKEIEKYLKLNLKDIKVPELKFWLDNKLSFPILSEIAALFLAAPATSVPSECLFSLSGYQCWDRRNRLLPENLEMIVFVYQNYELIW